MPNKYGTCVQIDLLCPGIVPVSALSDVLRWTIQGILCLFHLFIQVIAETCSCLMHLVLFSSTIYKGGCTKDNKLHGRCIWSFTKCKSKRIDKSMKFLESCEWSSSIMICISCQFPIFSEESFSSCRPIAFFV